MFASHLLFTNPKHNRGAYVCLPFLFLKKKWLDYVCLWRHFLFINFKKNDWILFVCEASIVYKSETRSKRLCSLAEQLSFTNNKRESVDYVCLRDNYYLLIRNTFTNQKHKRMDYLCRRSNYCFQIRSTSQWTMSVCETIILY